MSSFRAFLKGHWWARGLVALFIFAAPAGSFLAACGGSSGSPSAASSAVGSDAASAKAVGQNALDTLRADPGGADVEDAVKQCKPTTGTTLTTVVYVDTSSMSLGDKAKTWVDRFQLGNTIRNNWPTYKACVLSHLPKLNQSQRDQVKSCLAGKAFTVNFPHLSDLKQVWPQLVKLIETTFLGCYDPAAGLTASPSASSGAGNHSPPASPSPSSS
jgi:hypothetical protein